MAALGMIVKPFFSARTPKKESRTSRANVVSVQAKRPSPANSCGSSEQGAITRRAAILVTTIASGVTVSFIILFWDENSITIRLLLRLVLVVFVFSRWASPSVYAYSTVDTLCLTILTHISHKARGMLDRS